MSWVVQAPEVPVHSCRPPMRDHIIGAPPRGPAAGCMPPGNTIEDYPEPAPWKIGERPDGKIGDLWRCDECGELWRIIEPERQRYANIFPDPYPRWREAGWWLRFRHRNTERGKVES